MRAALRRWWCGLWHRHPQMTCQGMLGGCEVWTCVRCGSTVFRELL